MQVWWRWIITFFFSYLFVEIFGQDLAELHLDLLLDLRGGKKKSMAEPDELQVALPWRRVALSPFRRWRWPWRRWSFRDPSCCWGRAGSRNARPGSGNAAAPFSPGPHWKSRLMTKQNNNPNPNSINDPRFCNESAVRQRPLIKHQRHRCFLFLRKKKK